eukprot:1231060-Lingulodinium_polyedra.AAC.1
MDRMPWLVVVSPTAYEVIPTTPVGPRELSSAALGKADIRAGRIALLQVGKAVPYLRHAALHAFWSIPTDYLAKLATELEVIVPAPKTRVLTVAALIGKLCPELQPEQ